MKEVFLIPFMRDMIMPNCTVCNRALSYRAFGHLENVHFQILKTYIVSISKRTLSGGNNVRS